MKTIKLLTFLFCFVTYDTSFAISKDLKTSEDHHLIDRYPDSFITKYDIIDFERYKIPISPLKKVERKVYRADKSIDIEGKITKLVYSVPKEISNYQVYKNYLDSLNKDGFQIEYTCYEDSCDGLANSYFSYFKQQLHSGIKHNELPYYLVAKSLDKQRLAYIIVLIGSASRYNHIMVHVIETNELKLGKVKVNSDALLHSLDSMGKAEIYDIYFDTGKSAIKDNSKEALSAIAEVLDKRKDLNLYVVGHTDDTGNIQFNKKLSEDRSNSIVKYLINNFNISRDRLYPVGVGPFAPLASNDSKMGKAKNRRVELVKRLK